MIRPFYIYLHRDGRDVATSFKRAYVGPKHIYKLLKNGIKTKLIQLFLSSLPDHRFVQISYESLIQYQKKHFE